MVTPYPDLRHFTSRDYGNRVGVYRLLTALRDAGLKATFPINAALLPAIRPLLDAIAADGHEIAAHGLAADSLHWNGLDSAEETALIERTLAGFRAAGLTPRTWMSPARQQSFATLDLIAAAGFTICLDWEADTVPLALHTAHGPLAAVPLSNELDDRLLLIERRQSEQEWVSQIEASIRLLREEAPRFGAGTVTLGSVERESTVCEKAVPAKAHNIAADRIAGVECSIKRDTTLMIQSFKSGLRCP